MVSGPYKDPNQSPYDPPPADLETMDEIVKRKKKKLKSRAQKAVEDANNDVEQTAEAPKIIAGED